MFDGRGSGSIDVSKCCCCFDTALRWEAAHGRVGEVVGIPVFLLGAAGRQADADELEQEDGHAQSVGGPEATHVILSRLELGIEPGRVAGEVGKHDAGKRPKA